MNTEKTKKIMQEEKTTLPVGKYLRELSIVVLGVLISFGISNWIGVRNSGKDMKLQLTAIKLELEENINEIDSSLKKMKPSIDYADYLKSRDKKSINMDTLYVFEVNGGMNTIFSFHFNSNAFEMFKIGGMMRLVDDKDLLISIWDAYEEINEAEETLDWVMKIKLDEELKRLQWSEEEKKKNIPMYQFYKDSGLAYETENILNQLLAKLKETDEKLEKALK
ncbi:MAG: hypothetical protein LBE91_13090 [Tannerella sp.]|jgi:hypothetical protein|nr:hypothetical protein [Tannerella sp.]